MDSNQPTRKSIRLPAYDYGQPGLYFITICTHDKACLFGNVVDSEMELNNFGNIVEKVWHGIPEHFCGVELDEFVVMPNHVHGIIAIVETERARHASPVQNQHASPVQNQHASSVQDQHASPVHDQSSITDYHMSPNQRPRGAKPRSLGTIVGSFKSAVTKRINEERGTPGLSIWHRNYYEHIIRSDDELERIRNYIERNPANWERDLEYQA